MALRKMSDKALKKYLQQVGEVVKAVPADAEKEKKRHGHILCPNCGTKMNYRLMGPEFEHMQTWMPDVERDVIIRSSESDEIEFFDDQVITDELIIDKETIPEKEPSLDKVKGKSDVAGERAGYCQALTRSGLPCKNRALEGEQYCRVHVG